MGHFSLNVDPDQIERGGQGLIELGEHLNTRSGEIKKTPGDVPESAWKGAARDSIMKEVDGLGNQAARFGPMFIAAGEALKAVAAKARTAEDTTIPSLNSRWEGAQQTYRDDVGKADTKHQQAVADIDPSVTGPSRKLTREGIDDARTSDINTAGETRAATESKLTGEYNTLVSDLETAFAEASGKLTDNTVVAVPDETVSEFVKGGMTGLSPGKEGFPPEFGADKALAGSLGLTNDKHLVIDGEKVAKSLDEWERSDEKPPPNLDPETVRLLQENAGIPLFGQTVANQLGPDGVVRIMGKAKNLLGVPGAGNPDYYYADDPAKERERLVGLQDTIAMGLATTVASGSRAPGGLKDPNFGKTLVEKDPETAGILFKYADRAGIAFGGQFMHSAGTAIVEREANNPLIWQELYGNPPRTYGSDPKREDYDPGLWFLRAADNGADSAQAVMGDKNLMKHFLVDQIDHNGRDDQAGNVLRVATIDHARDPVPPGTNPQDSTAWRAAQIASNALDVTGENAEPLDGVKDELGGIIATYITDVDRAYTAGDAGPGVYDHSTKGWPGQGIVASDGFPQFGIMIEQGDLKDVLRDVGDNEVGTKLIAQSAAGYNQVRLDRGALETVDWNDKGESPFSAAARNSAQLQGFLTYNLAQGDIAGAEDEAAKREKVAGMFLLPAEFIPTDRLGPGAPVADFVIGQVSDAVTEAYVGDGVKVAHENSQNHWETTREELKMQSLESARVAGLLTPEEKEMWPKDDNGNPKPLKDLSEDERREVSRTIGERGGYASEVKGMVEGHQDDYIDQFEG